MDTSRKYAFLSYSRQDSQVADRISASLAARGVQVWRDVDQIEPGSQWEQAIERGLVGADAIIFLASRHAVTSRWMQFEVEAFLKRGKLVLPLVLDAEGPAALHGAFQSVQWLDISQDYERALDRLVEALLRAGIVEDHPLPVEAPKSKGYVFLSYAEEDTDFLEVLRPFLREHRYGYWDYQESDRDYHGQFILELEKVIEDAEATLSILSPSWKKSKWALREFLFSEEIGTPVILLRAKSLPPTLAVQGIPYIDFVPGVAVGIERLHKELKRKGL
jgi:hypothetical protein